MMDYGQEDRMKDWWTKEFGDGLVGRRIGRRFHGQDDVMMDE
jgi:hypothetical protein